MVSVFELSPELAGGLFIRSLGLIFLISFLSLSVQIVRGAGADGGMPIAKRLKQVRKDFPGPRRFLYFPTLLWISSSDWMLRLLTVAGLIASVAVMYGGEHSFWALLACYVCYLSLDMAIGLIFPWDCMLFEATLLALFLPPTEELPSLEATEAPAPILSWAYRLLIFRLMFGFGKQKFMGATLKDMAYLRGFLVAQPLPNAIGWYSQKLPLFFLQLLVVFMFLVEIPIPFFAFFPGDLSIICALTTAFLMVGIVSMGSFGYFSFLTIGACFILLDNTTPTLFEPSKLFAEGAPVATHAYVLAHTFGALCTLPFNSWVGQSWHLWSSWYRLPGWAQMPFHFFRFMHPFRWLHPYGVFPPNTYPGVKISLRVEVTWDEQEWHEVPFNYSPSNNKSYPKFVAPHHPRGDQAVIYETFGLNPTSLISGMVGPWDPYSFGTQPAANVLAQRITEGAGMDFMADGVLRQHETPPVMARITTIMLEPASMAEHRRTGDWWKVSYIGPHTPPRRVDPHFWDSFLPEPELWHPESIFWRRRSALGALMKRSEAGEDAFALALEGADELTPELAERFWGELVPSISSEQRSDLDTLADYVPGFRERYDHRTRHLFARLLGRYSALLLARLEPMYLKKGFSNAQMPAKTYLHLWMLTQEIIGDGREAYEAALAEPSSVAVRAADQSLERGLYLFSVFRYEPMVFEAQKLRLITAIMPPHDPAEKAKVAHSYDEMTPFEQFVARLAENFAGFFELMPLLRDKFKGPRFDHGFPERYPIFDERETGEVFLAEDQPAPEAADGPVHTPAQ